MWGLAPKELAQNGQVEAAQSPDLFRGMSLPFALVTHSAESLFFSSSRFAVSET
jgi:hypothetical protein